MSIAVAAMAMLATAALKAAVSAVMPQYFEASMMVSARSVRAGSAGYSEPVAEDLSA